MGDRRQATLLDFAIAASIAVVPLLLLVLIAVAEVRPADPSVKARPDNNQHVSLREVAALKTFERAIVRRDAARSPLPTADALLERFPQCRAEWDGRGGRMQRLRQLLSRERERSCRLRSAWRRSSKSWTRRSGAFRPAPRGRFLPG